MTLESAIQAANTAIGKLIEASPSLLTSFRTTSGRVRLIVAAAAIMQVRKQQNLTAAEGASSIEALSAVNELARYIVDTYGLTSLGGATVDCTTGEVTFQAPSS